MRKYTKALLCSDTTEEREKRFLVSWLFITAFTMQHQCIACSVKNKLQGM